MLAASAGAPAVLVSVAFIPLLSLAANGRLKRNQWVGIRTAHTMRNDQAWIAGHRAALRLAPLFVCATVLSCAALVVAAIFATPTIVMTIGLGSAGVLLAAFLYSGVVASRAAKSTGGDPDDGKSH
jgi:hypothetical protein